MTRETSIKVYEEIKAEGLLGDLQMIVYSDIVLHSPTTQGETARRLIIDRNTASPRFAELEKLGVIAEVGKRPCAVTGRTCIVYGSSSQRPKEIEKEESKDQKIARLEKRVAELELQIKKSQNCMFCGSTNAGH